MGTIHKTNERNISVDFIKFLATLLVLNSHMDICYVKYPSLATGGAFGDALFFFISGFTLFMGRKTDFINWYKRRINRIYPTIIAMGIISYCIFGNTLSFFDVITAQDYWFLKCILVCYIFLYPVIYYDVKLSICFPVVLLMVLLAFGFSDFGGAFFYGIDNYFRWLFFASIMLFGGVVYKFNDRIVYKKWHLIAMPVCVIAWYGINILSAYNQNISILSWLPLVGICYFIYSIGKASWIAKLFDRKIIGNVLFIIGNLCLESYMIQMDIITDKLNHIFPLNILIITVLVLISAYFLRVLSAIIAQVFDSKPFDWKALLFYKR